MKPQARPRKQRIKALLKKIASEGGPRVVPFAVFVADLIDDGQVNGSLIGLVID